MDLRKSCPTVSLGGGVRHTPVVIPRMPVWFVSQVRLPLYPLLLLLDPHLFLPLHPLHSHSLLHFTSTSLPLPFHPYPSLTPASLSPSPLSLSLSPTVPRSPPSSLSHPLPLSFNSHSPFPLQRTSQHLGIPSA